MAADHFCLRWNNYQNSMVSELDILRTEEYLVDVTLCCEGHKFRAHKVILSACSPYFRNVFKENPCEHPVVILKDVLPEDVEALLSFVYQGVVYVSEKKLASFLQTAELLQIKGLAGAASSFNEEQAKQAAALNSPVKRRKGAPVRIVKHGAEGDETSSMDAEDESGGKNDSVDDGEELKNEEDGSLEEESESEISGYAPGSCYSNPGDLKDENSDRYWANSVGCSQAKNDNVEAMLQQAIASQQLAQSQGQWSQSSPVQSMTDGVNLQNNSQASFQGPQSQGIPDLSTSPAVRNGRRPCPLCTKVISNKSNLLKHMRIRHSDVYNPICCVLCNKLFKNKYSLRAHVNIYHKEFITTSNSNGNPPTASNPQMTTAPSSMDQMTSHSVEPQSTTPSVPLPPPPLISHQQFMQSVDVKFP